MHLSDILDASDLIQEFVGNMSFEEYTQDAKTRSAVERQLQIVTEAAIRLGDDAERLCPGLDWRGIRGMGNMLRHGYHQIEDKIIWDTVKVELPPLRAAVLAALESSGTGG